MSKKPYTIWMEGYAATGERHSAPGADDNVSATATLLRAAEILECDIGTIKSRINRGRHLLRAALGETV